MKGPSPRHARWLCLLVFLYFAPLRAEPDPMESVEQAAAEWLKVRAETARISMEWNEQQQLLASMVTALTERAQLVEAKRAYLQSKTAKDREELAKLETSNAAATANLQAMEVRLKAMGTRLLKLRPSLPPRLSSALELPFRSLAEPALTLSERMQLTMTVLNRCTQFNRGITCDDEILNPGGTGAAQQLEVIYWGLSHGYALDRPAGKAWLGSPGPDGWQWEPATDAVKPVAQLIAIYRSKGEPAFVEVPVRLKNPSAQPSGK